MFSGDIGLPEGGDSHAIQAPALHVNDTMQLITMLGKGWDVCWEGISTLKALQGEWHSRLEVIWATLVLLKLDQPVVPVQARV